MDADILSQLVWIKWLLAGLIVLLACSGAVTAFVVLRIWQTLQDQSQPPFHELAEDILQQGQYEELLALAETRFKEYPGDPYGYWYHAKANYQLGNLDAALRSLHRVSDLQPDWSAAFVMPLVEAIEARGGRIAKPELRVIHPHPIKDDDRPEDA